MGLDTQSGAWDAGCLCILIVLDPPVRILTGAGPLYLHSTSVHSSIVCINLLGL